MFSPKYIFTFNLVCLVVMLRCLTKLCNPHNERIDEPDMIVCAPWAQEAFSCLAGDYDHSDCCRQRGLPDVCVELCTGNVKKIDYKYFRLEHWKDVAHSSV